MGLAVLDFGIGALIGGLMLSACWGWFWLAISTVGFTRGICGPRVVVNSLIVGLTPLLFGASVWWMRAEACSCLDCAEPPMAAGQASTWPKEYDT
jgi:hypothetical protein